MECEKCPMQKACELSKFDRLQLIAENLRPGLNRVLSTFCPLENIVRAGVDQESRDYVNYINQKRRFENTERMVEASRKEIEEEALLDKMAEMYSKKWKVPVEEAKKTIQKVIVKEEGNISICEEEE